MTTVKKLTGDYLITNQDAVTANVTVSTHTFFVNGNMVVGGNTSTVVKTDTDITDNIIVLNKGESGAGVTLGYSGINIDRGSLTDVGLRWNDILGFWQITRDGSIWGNLTTSLTGTALSFVYDDPSPKLSANLDITGNALFSSTANVVFYANTVNNGQGGSGVYVNNLIGTNEQELITKRKALTLSILFG